MIGNRYPGETPSVLQDITEHMYRTSQEAHKFAFDIIFAQLKEYLASLSTMEVRHHSLFSSTLSYTVHRTIHFYFLNKFGF